MESTAESPAPSRLGILGGKLRDAPAATRDPDYAATWPGQRYRIRKLRDFIVAAGAALALVSRVLAVEVDNFNLETTQDLVALCSVRSDDPLYAEALQFCYGYMAGVAQLHRALVHDNLLEPVACQSTR